MYWSVAQVVEHLLCKCKALSSNHSSIEREREVLFAVVILEMGFDKLFACAGLEQPSSRSQSSK
jgi:hypothetical protein